MVRSSGLPCDKGERGEKRRREEEEENVCDVGWVAVTCFTRVAGYAERSIKRIRGACNVHHAWFYHSSDSERDETNPAF
jgi:hypothetical protein